MSQYVIGIDVGGTNTDAVLLEFPSRRIIYSIKVPTTRNYYSGIMNAIQNLILFNNENINESHICSVILGTTVFLNALIEVSDDLGKVEIIRLCGETSKEFAPFINFPSNIKNKLQSNCYYINGGYEYDKKEIEKLDTEKLKEITKNLIRNYKESNSKSRFLSFVIMGIFSPVYFDQEFQVQEIIENICKQEKFIDYRITLSHKIGPIGLLEREASSILNASLLSIADNTIKRLKSALSSLHMNNCLDNIFLTNNDGTLMACEDAVQYPIFTINSGPTNSLRGASILSNKENAFVIDVGGTTTDVSVLKNGFPRPASSYFEIAGIRTNFFLPDSTSIGLGGGSIVSFNSDGECSIGPQSVGYKLTKEAQAFGGKILTTTDIAIANGHLKWEGADISNIKVTKEQINKVLAKMTSMLEEVIDKMKIRSYDVDVILVGGGSSLFPDNIQIKGVSNICKPQYYSVANAIGAAITQVSYTVEDLILGENEDVRKSQISILEQKAIDFALTKGAIKSSMILMKEEVHLAYIPRRTFRITCKAIGDLDFSIYILKEKPKLKTDLADIKIDQEELEPFIEVIKKDVASKILLDSFTFAEPIIENNNGRKEWILTEEDVEFMALGAGILGAGGGGSPYLGKIEVLKYIKQGKKIRIISPLSLNDNEIFYFVAHYGAPLIFIEKLCGSTKMAKLYLKIQEMSPDLVSAGVAPIEIGGLNSLAPLCVAANLDIPVLDMDFMGRAFPKFQMTTLSMNNIPANPCYLIDENTNLTRFDEEDPEKLESLLRTKVMEVGCTSGICGIPITKQQGLNFGVHNSLSRIWTLGRTLYKARVNKTDPFKVIEEIENGKLLFKGKITDLVRTTEGGYNKGTITVTGIDHFNTKTALVEFQNENLIVQTYNNNIIEQGLSIKDNLNLIAIVPDIITLCDSEDYSPVLTEDLRYGLRVTIISLPAAPIITNENALKHVSPKCFGYDYEYIRTHEYIIPKSIPDPQE